MSSLKDDAPRAAQQTSSFAGSADAQRVKGVRPDPSLAALDPEGEERRRQMEMLRKRMNEQPHARLGLEPP